MLTGFLDHDLQGMISENQVDNDQTQHQTTSLKQPFVSGPRQMSGDGEATNALKIKYTQICSPQSCPCC